MSTLTPLAEESLRELRVRATSDTKHDQPRLKCHLQDLELLERQLPTVIAQARASEDRPPARKQLLRGLIDLARVCEFDDASCHVLDWQLLVGGKLDEIITEARYRSGRKRHRSKLDHDQSVL